MNPHMFGSPCSPAAPLGPALVAAGLNSPPERSLAAVTMLQPASAQLTPEMGAIPAPPAAACTVSSMSCQRALFGRCTRTEIEAYFAKAELSLLMRPSPFM